MPAPKQVTVASRDDFKTVEEYADYLAGIVARNFRDMVWLMSGNLDVANIKAKSVTADRMNVKELSAIAADLGTITAGSIITNTTINIGTDARIGNILYLNEAITANKGIVFTDGTGVSSQISSLSGDMSFRVDGFISMTIGSSQGLVVNKKVTAPTFNATSNITINNVSVATQPQVDSKGSSLAYNSSTKLLSLKDAFGNTISSVTLA